MWEGVCVWGFGREGELLTPLPSKVVARAVRREIKLAYVQKRARDFQLLPVATALCKLNKPQHQFAVIYAPGEDY